NNCVCHLFFCLYCIVSFFFSSRRRHTRSKRDWSSDVCSSDLVSGQVVHCGGRSGTDASDPVKRQAFVEQDDCHGAGERRSHSTALEDECSIADSRRLHRLRHLAYPSPSHVIRCLSAGARTNAAITL